MGKLNRRKVLSKTDFEEHPIWIWDDAKEYKIPKKVDKNLSWVDADVFFIKAKFKTNGHSFDGYLVGNNDYYAFTLFVNSEHIKFNANADSLNKASLKTIFLMLNCKPFDFFPLEYESEVVFRESPKIAGKINM